MSYHVYSCRFCFSFDKTNLHRNDKTNVLQKNRRQRQIDSFSKSNAVQTLLGYHRKSIPLRFSIVFMQSSRCGWWQVAREYGARRSQTLQRWTHSYRWPMTCAHLIISIARDSSTGLRSFSSFSEVRPWTSTKLSDRTIPYEIPTAIDCWTAATWLFQAHFQRDSALVRSTESDSTDVQWFLEALPNTRFCKS